ncbi:MAG: hypothetical protein JKY37_05090 [Nannocystaceae bacterium]|nr:hypothetical protein [Nannocystaceae bacterium]
MSTERRVTRSAQPHVALGHFLEAEARRRGARAMAVGTTDGLPIAAWGEDALLVAAAGSVFAMGKQRRARAEIADVDATLLESSFGPLVFTCCGVAAKTPSMTSHIQRILG